MRDKKKFRVLYGRSRWCLKMDVWKIRLDMVIGRKTIKKRGGQDKGEKNNKRRGGKTLLQNCYV